MSIKASWELWRFFALQSSMFKLFLMSSNLKRGIEPMFGFRLESLAFFLSSSILLRCTCYSLKITLIAWFSAMRSSSWVKEFYYTSLIIKMSFSYFSLSSSLVTILLNSSFDTLPILGVIFFILILSLAEDSLDSFGFDLLSAVTDSTWIVGYSIEFLSIVTVLPFPYLKRS